jgi:hypothetical protein
LIPQEFDSTVFPVAAVNQARIHRLPGPLFSEFAWGGYLIYAWPEQKIFIDGGTDFFGEQIFREYVQIKQMRPSWRDLLERYHISLMLLEREKPFTYEVARDGRWMLWYCDSLAVVFRRSTMASAVTPSGADSVQQILPSCAQHPITPSQPKEPMISQGVK